MPDQLMDKQDETPAADRHSELNASGAVPKVPARRLKTAVHLDRRSMLHLVLASLLILAGAAVLTMMYMAKLILIVVLVSILLSFVLAPLVDMLTHLQIPRGLGALIAVTTLLVLLGATTYLFYSRAIAFMEELPKYRANIQAHMANIRAKAQQIEQTTETVLPQSSEERNAVTVKQTSSWTDLVSRTASSVSEFVLALTFIPFLVFFMLSWQDHVRSATVMLFRMENRNTAYTMLGLIAGMIRSFIVGNFIIAVFLSGASIALFGIIGLPYFYFLGVISGFVSIVPYLGVVLAVLPPLVADLGHLTTTTSLIIVGGVVGLHLVGMNVLYPKVLGKRLQLNPLAVTLALLFWGWLWGPMGLILAVPITGVIKIICDHIERLQPYGAWLGE
jgi:predicted PurR-regulated permease PerM